MRDWKTLLAVPRFRALWIALLFTNLGSWSVMAALPILVADRFGAGTALVLSLGWRILPKIVLAPVSSVLLRRWGAPRVACLALLAESGLTAALPWCDDFSVLQCALAAIGALDVFMMPGLLSLRGTVTPPGFELAGNSLCSMADRVGKTVGPAVGGLAVTAGYVPAFAGFAVAILLAAVPVTGLPRPAPETASRGWTLLRMPGEFWRMLRGDHVLVGLLVCAVSYMVMIGGLRPFLFWANRDWFGAADTAWTGLMAAQGAGAVIGALVAGTFNRALLRRASAYTLTMVTAIMEGMFHLLLLLTPGGGTGAWMAMAILAAAGIPEVISTATWFTAMQQRLSPERQGLFFAFTSPLWDCAYAVGVMSAGLHAADMLALAPWWAMLSLTATLPILPVWLWNAKPRRRRAFSPP
jgi:predicted MFS family arabinose efflux permease